MRGVQWVVIECHHEGRGVDAEPEAVHRHYGGDDPEMILAQWREHGVSARMVHDRRLAETVGEFRANRGEPGTYAHRALFCSACKATVRVPADRLNRAMWTVVDNGRGHADAFGVLRMPLSALAAIVSRID